MTLAQISKVPLTVAELGNILDRDWLPSYSVIPSMRRTFTIEMSNTYLNYHGHVKKRQRLVSDYVRSTVGYCSSNYLKYECKVNSAIYSEDNPNHQRKKQTDLSFPRGKTFDLCKTLDSNTEISSIESLGWQAYTDAPMHHFNRLPPTPIVHLFQLLIYDVVMFEELHSQILMHAPSMPKFGDRCLIPATSLMPSLGEEYGIPASQTDRVEMSFNGSNQGRSFFSVNDLPVRLSAVTLSDGKPLLAYEYHSVGRLNAVNSAGTHEYQKLGESHYRGTVYVDLETGDLHSALMHEALTHTTKSSSGKETPAHTRRRVTLKSNNSEPQELNND